MHVVWDWNGTLLDDLPIVIEAANASLGMRGQGPITEDDYRDHFTRPIRNFYDALLGRAVTDDEWQALNSRFHKEYRLRVERARLTVDAHDALDSVEALGWSQSLLSMSSHPTLMEVVEAEQLLSRFLRVDGLREEAGGLKEEHLRAHLEMMRVSARDAFVVGDTPDDHAAAVAVGATPILYDGGSHHLHALETLGAPIAPTLSEAVLIARDAVSG